jgi:hypothetical protein
MVLPGSEFQKVLDSGCWMLGFKRNSGFRGIQNSGCWMLDAECWMLDSEGFRIHVNANSLTDSFGVR